MFLRRELYARLDEIDECTLFPFSPEARRNFSPRSNESSIERLSMYVRTYVGTPVGKECSINGRVLRALPRALASNA
jgi:hypothetical protein